MKKKYLKTFFFGLLTSTLFGLNLASGSCFCSSVQRYAIAGCSGSPSSYGTGYAPGATTPAACSSYPSTCMYSGGSYAKYMGCAWNM